VSDRGRVKMLDLQRQLRPMLAELERTASDVIGSGWFLLGRRTKELEESFAGWLGTTAAVACANGTDAITLSLLALGIGEGDGVVTVPNTAFATACAITKAGARPVFVDIDRGTWLIDIEAAAGAAREGIKAVVSVHLYGHAVDIPKLQGRLPDGVAVVEDCAQAHGTAIGGLKAGTFADIAAFSFYPSKNLCALGDAGMVVSDSGDLAERVRQLRFYGQDGRDNHVETGMNSRIDEMQAALLSVELNYLDGWIGRRREIARIYSEELDADVFKKPVILDGSDPSYHLYVVKVERRDELRDFLDRAGIDTGVHYPVPIHLQPAYASLGYSRGDFPNAEQLAGGIVSLPVSPHLDDGEVDRVVAACGEYARAGG
jgi:dTDP-4-amino-4,6-dideoxygalactose transaminase